MQGSLEGKIAIVTGSTSGIGRGIAEHFAGLGASLVIHGRDRADGLETVRRCRAAGREAEYFDGDLTSEAVCRGLIRVAVERFGGLDILVNNAADVGRATSSRFPSRAGTPSWRSTCARRSSCFSRRSRRCARGGDGRQH